MSEGLTIPADEMAKFNRTFNDYIKHNRRTLKQIVDAKALDWAHKSLVETDKANSASIATALGQVGTEVKESRPRKGKDRRTRLRAGKKIYNLTNSVAARIINKRRRDSGRPMLFDKEMEKAVKALIGARIKAVAFIKAGWIPAIKKLDALVPDRSIKRGEGGAKVRGRPKGNAIHERSETSPATTIINTANKDNPKAAGVATRGMIKGMHVVIADMRVYIERKLQETANKYNAK